MSPADRLREAARILREAAEALPEWNFDDGRLWITDYDPSDPTGQTAMQRPVGGADEPWASYIALVNPVVGLAVADWMEKYADILPEERRVNRPAYGDLTRALAVADALLAGGTPTDLPTIGGSDGSGGAA